MPYTGNVKLRFLNCEGLCLQAGDSLSRISTSVLEIKAETSLVYLMTTKGVIRCVLLTDKREYESPDNVDRRTSNVTNEFNVLWDDDGEYCTVFYNPAPKKRLSWILTAAGGLVVGLLVGWLVTYLCMGKPKVNAQPGYEASRVVSNEIDMYSEQQYTVKTQAVSHLPSPNDDVPSDQVSQVRIKEFTYRLHSSNCTVQTVTEIKKWFDSLDEKAKATVDAEKFARVLEAYMIFFNAEKIGDLNKLVKYRYVFSPYQWNVIHAGYGVDSGTFTSWKQRFGMSFRKPLDLGLVDNIGMPVRN